MQQRKAVVKTFINICVLRGSLFLRPVSFVKYAFCFIYIPQMHTTLQQQLHHQQNYSLVYIKVYYFLKEDKMDKM
jgi:hypothetical protein